LLWALPFSSIDLRWLRLRGYSGLDFVRIDSEHSWRRDESMENMIRAAYMAEIRPIFLVDKGDSYIIRKAMEIGASRTIQCH
jgi:2-keto-3-deoxy-L-rhamnonate aldolase RhmA